VIADVDPVATIVVRGHPAPQGSKKAFLNRHTGRIQQVEMSPRLPGWRDNVRQAAVGEILCSCRPDCRDLSPGFPLDEALVLTMVFTMPKPGSAPKSRKTWPDKMPDLSKLARSTEDALQEAGVYSNDARIVDYRRLAKVFPNEDPDALGVPGVIVRVWRAADVLLWHTPDPASTPDAPALFPVQL